MLKITMKNRFLSFFILLMSLSAAGQNQGVSGMVTDENGAPLPSVNVIQKGTSNGVVTDFDGKYSITMQQGEKTLVFTFIGYKSVERQLDNQTVLNVQMETDDVSLDEVVIVGYGQSKKSDVTGSVSSVGSEDLEKAVFNTVDQMLQGRTAGVTVTSSSGKPGEATTIRIRGSNSILGDNSPLYVVDGVPISGVPNFNPTDIDRMEVLKDASATAIYGARGANGVIVVTTKSGRVGKTKLSVNFDSTFSEVTEQLDVLQGSQYAAYRNEAVTAAGGEAPFPNPSQYDGQGFNWQDEILRLGLRNNLGISVQGGKDDVKFFVSGNFLDDAGIVLNSKYTRGTLRSNIDTDLFNDKLKVQFRTNVALSKSENAISAANTFPSSLGPITNAILSEPLVPSRDYSGTTQEGFIFYNPYLEVTEKQDRTFDINALLNGKAIWQVSDHLSLTSNLAYNVRNNLREIFYPSNVGVGIEQQGRAESGTNRGYDLIVSNYLNYNNTFNEIHALDATGGVEYSEFNNYAFSTNVSNFGFELLGLDNVGVATSRNGVGSGRSLAVLQSGFLRLNYTLMDRYLFTVTGRADGSSRFAENEKWGYFPSAAVGWRISEEEFLADSNTISNLKIRVSYGETGSQAISPYQSIARYATVNYPIGNIPTTAFVPVSVENPNLKWETTEQTNAGIDIGLSNNRFTLSVDVYKKTTRDLLSAVNLPAQTGFTTAVDNFGSIENKGIEVDLGYRVINAKKFKWETNLNGTTYKTKVLELGGDGEYFGPGFAANFAGSGHIYRPGDEFGLFYGYVATGLIQQSDLDAAEASGIPLPALNEDRTLGHWKFQDMDGDGVITDEDRTVIGNPNPDLVFGWNNDFIFGDLTLNIFVQGSIGNDIYNTLGTITHSGWLNDQSYKNQSVDWYENRWTPENPTNDIRYPSLNNQTIPVGNYMVEDGSYVRLKSVSLFYNIPKTIFNIDNLQLYVTGTNIWTITKYTGFDPEVSSLGANSLAPGVDLGTYPRSRSYTIGIKATF